MNEYSGSIKYLDELENELEKLAIEKKDVCLTGSEIISLVGIRDNHDLDIILNPTVLKKMRGIFPRGFRWRINLTENIELYRNHLDFIGISDLDIFSKKWFFEYRGFKIIPLGISYLEKEMLRREKDIKDIEMMLDRFPLIKEEAEPYRQSIVKIRYMRLRRKIQSLLMSF